MITHFAVKSRNSHFSYDIIGLLLVAAVDNIALTFKGQHCSSGGRAVRLVLMVRLQRWQPGKRCESNLNFRDMFADSASFDVRGVVDQTGFEFHIAPKKRRLQGHRVSSANHQDPSS